MMPLAPSPDLPNNYYEDLRTNKNHDHGPPSETEAPWTNNNIFTKESCTLLSAGVIFKTMRLGWEGQAG